METQNASRQLPEVIGGLGIVFSYDQWVTPHHIEQSFVLPANRIGQAFVLKDGAQAVVTLKFDHMINGNQRAFMFGLDDSPFMTQISNNRFRVLAEQGEEAFYESLKPRVIRLMEEDGCGASRRQGDIWAIKVAPDWSEAKKVVGFREVLSSRQRNAWNANFQIFNSRHHLKGEIMSGLSLVIKRTLKKRARPGHEFNIATIEATLACGKITAPDHPDLDISDAVYLISRTSGQTEACMGMD
jgi:hypothetical protein